MNLDDKEPIKEVPRFESEMSGVMELGQLTKEQKFVVEALCRIEQKADWACETSRMAYNLALGSARQIQTWKVKFQSPVAIAIWLLGIATCAFIGAWIQKKMTGHE